MQLNHKFSVVHNSVAPYPEINEKDEQWDVCSWFYGYFFGFPEANRKTYENLENFLKILSISWTLFHRASVFGPKETRPRALIISKCWQSHHWKPANMNWPFFLLNGHHRKWSSVKELTWFVWWPYRDKVLFIFKTELEIVP